MNSKSVDSTDSGPAQLQEMYAALVRDFPYLASKPEAGEPESGLFRSLELVALPEPARQILSALGLSFLRTIRELGQGQPVGRMRQGPSLSALLVALIQELQSSVSHLGEALAATDWKPENPEQEDALRLVEWSLHELSAIAARLEASLPASP